jgi:type II secretory pathway component PulJ
MRNKKSKVKSEKLSVISPKFEVVRARIKDNLKLLPLVLTGAKGMTLAEVVASLALSILLLGMLSQFLYSGAGLWNKNDQAYQNQHQLKFIYQTIANDLENVFSGRFLPEETFQGEEYHFNCWCESNSGLKRIEYRYDLQEKAVWRWAGYWGSAPEERKLYSGVSEWRFEYFDPKNCNWVLSWDPSTKTELPSLLKVTAKTDLGVIGPVVFSIKSWRDEEEE